MRFPVTLAALALAFALSSCKSLPIHNVSQAPVTNAAGKSLTPDQVRNAIVRAGTSLGWQMKDAGADRLLGDIQVRNHAATVEIAYSASTYSIKYRSSENLKEEAGNIHKRYNGWIQNLHRSINGHLAAL